MWRALTDPDEVVRWAGVTPMRVADDYPQAGQYALWHDRGRVLHDVIITVDPDRRLTSRLAMGPATVLEDYVLRRASQRSIELRASWRGHAALALGNDAGMRRLRSWCERRAPS